MNFLNRPKCALLLMTAIGMVITAGCGTETYNNRVEQSAKLFAYLNRLNENLGTLWSNSGVEIRMPRQLTEIPPPPMVPNENGVLEQAGEDERQPDFSSVEFPGLIGAWKGTVEAEVAGEVSDEEAYAYVMSNAYLWGKGEQEEALVFKDTVAQAVMDGLSLPPFNPEDWKRETYPRSAGFIPQQSANVWVTKTERVIGKSRAELSMHLFQNGDIQVAVLFIYPETILSSEHITDRIGLALETIKISPDLPSGMPAAGPTGGGPTGGF